MNIFYLDSSPKKCATYHCDKHVVKMITEHNQMLCTNLHLLEVEFVGFPRIGSPYKKSHVNHPCTKWLRESKANTMWLLAMNHHLCVEYSARYGRKHAGEAINRWLFDIYSGLTIIDKGLTEVAQAMPEACKACDPIKAYRTYYGAHKSKFATWKFSETPEFFKLFTQVTK